MQRTQIYLEPDLLSEIKRAAIQLNVSVSEYIRRVLRTDLQKKRHDNLKDFVSHMQPLESFSDIDAEAYVKNIRLKNRIVRDD